MPPSNELLAFCRLIRKRMAEGEPADVPRLIVRRRTFCDSPRPASRARRSGRRSATAVATSREPRFGNTEVLAQMIRGRIGSDVHRIEPTEPYPTSYDETVQRNEREQNANATPPAIANPLPSIAQYDSDARESPSARRGHPRSGTRCPQSSVTSAAANASDGVPR